MTKERAGGANRLIHEKSPYLLQHAHNPVDWYPWSDEAFARARAEDKPVFLSVGYSTCHWCHVMERESFEHQDVADILNANYIAIKVDREERPDVDALYMSATQLMTGHGGWPNSLWLMPDGRPWYAGTYFPREDGARGPGFKTALLRLADVWRTQREMVEEQANRLSEAVRMQTGLAAGPDSSLFTRALVERAIAARVATYDAMLGGFGGAPKFPPHGALRLFLYEAARVRATDAPRADSLLQMVEHTLDAMDRGGFHDHIGGGFHRYATDARWFLPHFEKMLYDNAQLARAYAEAYRLTGNERWRRVARDAYDWVLREMTGGEGGFYSALDADSEGEEGKFYLWRESEILEVLGEPEGRLVCEVFGVEHDGNYFEEASGARPGTNILHLPRPLDLVAAERGMDEEALVGRLENARTVLRERRARRAWPHLDDKVLASWNGLMIGSLAYGGRALGEPRYVEAARRGAEFVLTHMRRDGRLLRSWREGDARLNAYLDDYAFLADALLDLAESTGERRWVDEAASLLHTLERWHGGGDEGGQGGGEQGGFYFTSSDHETLLARAKDPLDHALPSGNGIAAQAFLRLHAATGEPRYRAIAERTCRAFLPVLESYPNAAESLVLAAAMFFDAGGTGAPAPAAESTADAAARSGPVLAEAYAARQVVKRGERFSVAVRLRIDRGWHVNSHRPREEYLIPTELRVAEGRQAALRDLVYPKDRIVRFEFSEEPLAVYEGEVWIRGAAELEGKADGLTMQLTVQPCDDSSCLAPETLELAIPVRVGDRPKDEPLRHPEVFTAGG